MKTKILLLFTLITFLFACETNDDPNISITEADLMGTWSLKSQTLEEGTITVSSQGDSFSANYSAVAEDIFQRFDKGGTGLVDTCWWKVV